MATMHMHPRHLLHLNLCVDQENLKIRDRDSEVQKPCGWWPEETNHLNLEEGVNLQ